MTSKGCVGGGGDKERRGSSKSGQERPPCIGFLVKTFKQRGTWMAQSIKPLILSWFQLRS